MKKLNHRFVESVTGKGRYFDGGSGLHLLVKVGLTGLVHKYWVYRFTFLGKRRDKGLGVFPTVSLSQARLEASRCRVEISQGENPLAKQELVPTNRGTTFDEFSEEWISNNQLQWKNRKHVQQWENTLRQYASPHIGQNTIDTIETRHVMAVLSPIWISKTETATRLRERIERILAAAIVLGYRKGPNPAAWRGHLEFLLPTPSKIHVVTHHAAMDYKELPDFYRGLSFNGCTSAHALRLLILTACRTSEVTGAEFDEFNGDLWVIPQRRMKSGRPHRIPLSSPAVRIVDQLRLVSNGSPLLFENNGKPLSNAAMYQLLKRRRADLTIHGFRSSFRSWSADLGKTQPQVAEMALAHSVGNALERAYQRSDLLELRRELMDRWGTYLERTSN